MSSAGEPEGVLAPREGQSAPAAGGLPSESAEMWREIVDPQG